MLDNETTTASDEACVDDKEKLERIECVIDNITFQNPDNGYAVLKVSIGCEKGIPLVGTVFKPSVGSVLLADGRWQVNKKYGRQFYVVSYIEKLPTTEHGIEKYLSGLIKGIGPNLAKKIVEKFGSDTPRIIKEEPERLKECYNIGKKRIDLIHKNWMDAMGVHEVMMFLLDHNISPSYATKIYKRYGAESIRIISDNPYRLASEVWGIGFLLADRVAATFGFRNDHIFRCRSGILYTLTMLSENGHVYYPKQELLSESMDVLGVELPAVINALLDLVLTGHVINDDGRIYLPSLYYAEKHVAERICFLSAIQHSRGVTLERAFSIGKSLGIEYDIMQAEAITKASSSGIMILTGGPGTGKTTTVQGILKALSDSGKTVLLAAPTGRAAKRMSEATGWEAKTIHRLLEYSPVEGFKRNKENPLLADVLVVDECSMIDIRLMDALLDAVPDTMSVLLVGDIDQLPSVGPGNILQDVIRSKVCSVVRLEHIFRQAMGSNIIVNAHLVNKGYMPKKDNSPTSDFFLMERNDKEPEEVAELIVDLVSRRLPQKYQISPLDIQVLCPMRKGATGANTLNSLLQEAINPGEGGIARRGIVYRVGDKVMQLRNNYDKEVYNGDIGVIVAVDKEEETITIRFDDRDIIYDFVDFEEVIHAYATTIHKSQGSEYRIVVMPLLTSHYVMLQRNLLYTGITRAKDVLVLIGSKKAISIAVHNQSVLKRYTYLSERLCEIAKQEKVGVA